MNKHTIFNKKHWIKIGFVCTFFVMNTIYASWNIHERGYWIGEDVNHHFDPQLASAIIDFLHRENAETVADFGCGNGRYVHALLDSGIICHGYDENPSTKILSAGIGTILDLSIPFELDIVYDWIVCLEVGEHIPQKYESILLDNIHRHNSKGVILSWAVKGQGGDGHFNEQNNNYVKDKMKKLGYVNDIEEEKVMRQKAGIGWFKNTIMIFRKNLDY